jgi:hypothetical protein
MSAGHLANLRLRLFATTRIAADYDPTRDSPFVNGKQVDPYAGLF